MFCSFWLQFRYLTIWTGSGVQPNQHALFDKNIKILFDILMMSQSQTIMFTKKVSNVWSMCVKETFTRSTSRSRTNVGQLHVVMSNKRRMLEARFLGNSVYRVERIFVFVLACNKREPNTTCMYIILMIKFVL